MDAPVVERVDGIRNRYLEEARHDHDAQFVRQLAQAGRRRTGYRFGQAEVLVALHLREVRRVYQMLTS